MTYSMDNKELESFLKSNFKEDQTLPYYKILMEWGFEVGSDFALLETERLIAASKELKDKGDIGFVLTSKAASKIVHLGKNWNPPDINDLAQKLKGIELCSAPSTFGMTFDTEQAKLQFRCHRPASCYGAHVSLFHSIFAHFTERLKDAPLGETDSRFTMSICESMSSTFSSENERTKKFSELFSEYLGLPLEIMTINRNVQSNVSNDGAVMVPIERTGISGLVMSIEAKPEIGKGKGCAYMEAIGYHAIYAAEKATTILARSCLPSFLCILTGPYFQVYGTVFTDNLHCDPLTPIYPLFVQPFNLKMMHKISKLFAALKLSILKLVEYYSSGAKDEQRGFPAFSKFENLSWQYNKQLFQNKQVWLAKTKANSTIVIKFSERLTDSSLQALITCSKQGIAPDIIFHTKWGKWTVLAMTYIEGNSLGMVLKSTPSKEVRVTLMNRVKSLAQRMHQLQIVHGDLRENNIIVSQDLSKVYFIDFDYSGKVGQNTVYPMYLSTQLQWPDGVGAGLQIEAKHDMDWLNRTAIVYDAC